MHSKNRYATNPYIAYRSDSDASTSDDNFLFAMQHDINLTEGSFDEIELGKETTKNNGKTRNLIVIATYKQLRGC